MKHLRQWEIQQHSPYELSLSADARLCQSSYTDDQSWYVLPGISDQPALTLQTHYGFRVGLASLVPMWVHDSHTIYQAQTYHKPPFITAFAPNYIAAEAFILPELALKAEHLALSSQAMGGIYTLSNSSKRDISIRLDIFGHVGAGGKEQKLALINLTEGGHGLVLGTLSTIAPVVLIERGSASELVARTATPKIGREIVVKAGASARVRFVHVGLGALQQSLAEARRWLALDWQAFLASIDTASLAIPSVQTGDDAWDLVLASGYNRIVQAILQPTGSFPRETFVAARLPEHGYSKRGDGTDHPRMWEGQMPELAYLLSPVLASIDPKAAEGILRNYLALQKADGFIDMIPNAGGAHSGLLCTPILARTSWAVYEQSGNQAFLKECFGGLRKFFDYWLKQDMDGDACPEWQDERQMRYITFPTFGMGWTWAQGANPNTVESPDLLAYLLSEATALLAMAEVLGDKAASKSLKSQINTLKKGLAELWDGQRYSYRDRDSNITTSGNDLLQEGAGDIEHVIERPLAVPNRVIVTIIGGVKHVPQISLVIRGLDKDGRDVTETAAASKLYWQDRQGVYTSQTIFSQVTSIRCDGLSRVYRVFARTMDTSGLDLNALMPLIADIPQTEAAALAKLALSKDFQRSNGITMTSIENHFDPSNAEGAGGAWFYWQTLLGEALIEAGYGETIADSFKAKLDMLVKIYGETHHSGQFYHSDEPLALGEKGHLLGIAPLLLFQRLIGLRIVSPTRVLIKKEFAWGKSITIKQHGISVQRTNKKIKIKFGSQKAQEFDAPLESDLTVDALAAIETISFEPIRLPIVEVEAPKPSATKRIVIDVEHEE
jgi:hypothetical protein